MFTVGDNVVNVAVKEWGFGKVLSITGNYADVLFANGGKRRLSLVHAKLEIVHVVEMPNLSGQRPFMNFTTNCLGNVIDQNWFDCEVLQKVNDELPYRKRKAAAVLRQKVVSRLYELSIESFLWPTTNVEASECDLENTDEWPKKGILGFMSYKVGEQGINETSRHDILDYVYSQDLPNVNSIEYMKEWGVPRSSRRLMKMAQSIASFARNAKKRNDNKYELAISEWEADLDYLKCTYYKNNSFIWPKISG